MTQLTHKLLDLFLLYSSDFEIAVGVVLGLHLGLIPCTTLQWFLAFCVLVLFRVNFLSTFTVALVSFAFAELAEPLFHHLGLKVLTGYPQLYSTWGWMYHMPIVPFTRFNNTVILGCTLTAYIFSIPVFFVSLSQLKRVRYVVSKLWYSTRMSRAYSHYAKRRQPQ